jgi:uncharacterized protein (DUF2267 family)
MTREDFLLRVTERLGVGEAEAEVAVRAVIPTIAERVSRLEAESLAGSLPQTLRELARGGAHGEDFGLPELYARVAHRAGVRIGIAVEYATAVGPVIGEAIGPDALHRLAAELPPDWLELLRPPDRTEAPPPHLHPERRTLAEGRPGGTRPLYEARPGTAQTDSVAAGENPHADTKLSSSPGLTQEREDETLAAGRPGSTRPLSDLDH